MEKFFNAHPGISIFLRKIVELNFREQKCIIREHFNALPQDRVLDFGCGTGELSVFFSPEQYTGIDIDSHNIAYAKKHYRGNFLVADGTKLPFTDKSFTKILIVGVFHHLNDAQSIEAIREIKRVLAPEGIVLCMEDTMSRSWITELMHKIDQGDYIKSFDSWHKMFQNEFALEKSWTFKNGICFYSAFLMKMK